MKIKNIFGLALLFTMALLTQGCSDDDNATTPASALDVTKDGVKISSLDFQLSASSQMVGIETDGDWTVSVPDADSTWLSVTPHAGYGWDIADTAATNTKAYVRVSVTKNEGEARSSVLTVTAGSLTKQVAINQVGSNTDSNDPFESAWDMVGNFKLGYNLVVVVIGVEPCGVRIAQTVVGTSIMLHVEDAVATSIEHIAHNFHHAVHPSLIDGVVTAIEVLHVGIPCHRHTDDVEALGSDGVDDFLRGLRLSPLCFPVFGCSVVEP